MPKQNRTIFVLRIMIFLALSLSLGACGMPSREIPRFYYYTVDYGHNAVEVKGCAKATVKVKTVRSPSPYDTTRMVYRTNPYQFEPSIYHLWVARPGDMLADLLVRYLTQSGSFSHVYGPYDTQNSDYELELFLEEFDCRTYGSRPLAVIKMTAILDQSAGGMSGEATVMKKTYSSELSCSSTNAKDVAFAMSAGIKDIFSRLIQDVCKAISVTRSWNSSGQGKDACGDESNRAYRN